MAENSIILTADEVTEILKGNQTRLVRLIKPKPRFKPTKRLNLPMLSWKNYTWDSRDECRFPTPYGQGRVNDLLFGKETWRGVAGCQVNYRADNHCEWFPGECHALLPYIKLPAGAWRSASTMPRWASRIRMEIVSVKARPQGDLQWAWVIDFQYVKRERPNG